MCLRIARVEPTATIRSPVTAIPRSRPASESVITGPPTSTRTAGSTSGAQPLNSRSTAAPALATKRGEEGLTIVDPSRTWVMFGAHHSSYTEDLMGRKALVCIAVVMMVLALPSSMDTQVAT